MASSTSIQACGRIKTAIYNQNEEIFIRTNEISNYLQASLEYKQDKYNSLAHNKTIQIYKQIKHHSKDFLTSSDHFMM